jgi:ribosomal protein S18 acetylase RimI-like enzyme
VHLAVRPLTDADVDPAREVQTRAFQALDHAFGEPAWEETTEVVERQRRRFRHFLSHDPEGSWVAEVDGRVAGAALALRREGLWGLSLLVVDPEQQSRGVGRALLDASLRYAEGTAADIILSSRDARAIRRYATAGFDLFPQVDASGPVAGSRLRRPEVPVRDGGAGDADFADAVDRLVRGGARGPDHEVMAAAGAMFVVDQGARRGYAYSRADGRLVTIAATDETAAEALLWTYLGHEPDHTARRTVDHLTGEQQWAVRTVLAAGLRIGPGGPVFWRGRTPPRCYIPDGAYL